MKINKKILPIAIGLVLLLALFTFWPGQTTTARAQAGTVVYNLFATDGYIQLPDGGPLYMYGFIGGREGVPLTYQPSFDPVSLVQPPNVTLQTGAPAPTGGPITGDEAQLAGHAQFPAPIIWAAVGDVVEIRLKNLGVAANPEAPNDPHSIHLHGMDVDAANDGVPETSLAAVPANLPDPGAGNVVVYMFSPVEASTYMYHCHQEADIHVQMGMFGALVVYNPDDPAYTSGLGPGSGQGGTVYGHRYDKDYILLLSEFDVRGHQDEEGTYDPESWDPDPYNWAFYKPQYWMINGLSFPQTVHASFPSGYSFADWVAAHPGYDPLITGSVSVTGQWSYPKWGTPGEKVLIRVINLGFETQPMHMHGYHGKILGSDQRGWSWANSPGGGKKGPTAFGSGLEKNTLTIGSGETYEWLVDFGQQSFQSTYPTGNESCYDPNTGLPVPNGTAGCVPIEWDEAEYIAGPVVTGVVNIFDGGPPLFQGTQFFPFHNHDDYKATNNGAYPGGMFTMLVPTP